MKRRVLVAGVLAATLGAGCHKRRVEVRTAPPAAAQASVQVKNDLTQAVNVYITLNGNDTFLRQVSAKTTVTLPVPSTFAPGSTVALKAVTADGVRTFQRQNVVLTGTYVFPLP